MERVEEDGGRRWEGRGQGVAGGALDEPSDRVLVAARGGQVKTLICSHFGIAFLGCRDSLGP